MVETKIQTQALEDAYTSLLTGWIEVSDSWSYASATTITVPSGAASIYETGMKLRIKQGGGYKYYYITGIADTTLTVNGGTDYTVANSAITDIAYSPAAAPLDFPHYFTYVPTFTPQGSMTYSSVTYAWNKFSIQGKTCHFFLRCYGTIGGTPSTYIDLTVPVTGANANAFRAFGRNDSSDGQILDAGDATKCRAYKDALGNWSSGTGKYISFSLVYPIA